ncbi:pyridoxal phosphate-dependent aminotransferase [Cohnella cellulosilytica]|uniref:Aminotransferase n=1 Tax=Cohnella cellulosilytica TaxID=986710 RepID=A0ABW2FJC8_9BACL
MHNPKMQISNRVSSIPPALSIYINELVYSQKRKGRDIVTLSLGEAFFDIPMFDFNQLNVEKCYHYSESNGIPELRRKITEFYLKQYKAEINYQNEILITAGSKPVIYMAMQAVLNSGDEVLIHEPAWLSYQEQARLVDVTPKFIPFDCDIDDFHKHFTGKTRMLVVNNPNNPAGWLYSKEQLASIYKQCRSRGIYVLVDEAYSDFLLDETFYSMINLVPDKDGIIVVNSLSKNMGMSGWRIGYVVSSVEVISNIQKLNQHLITCAPTILQHYLARYFDEIIAITLPQAREVVQKRQRISEYMDQIGLKRLPGSSTFYFFVHIGQFEGSSMDFCLYLLFKYGVATVPGSAYGASTERFIRVSFGTESEERIHLALALIKDLITEGNCDEAYIHANIKSNGYKFFEETYAKA